MGMKGAGLIMGRTEQFFFLNMQFSQTNKWKLYMSLPNHKYEKQPRTRVPRSWMAISTTCQLYKRLRQSTPFCPEFPKQHEKNLTEPPEKKKRHSGRKKLKWFKCPKTQTEYPELIDNTWAAERTHVSVAGWGNVTHFKRSTRSSDSSVWSIRTEAVLSTAQFESVHCHRLVFPHIFQFAYTKSQSWRWKC